MSRHYLSPIREALLKKANIPLEWSFEIESPITHLTFNINFVNYKDNCVDRLQNALQLFKKSSVGDRFQYMITEAHTDWGYSIRVSILVYTRKGEKVEDLVTVLRLEGLV